MKIVPEEKEEQLQQKALDAAKAYTYDLWDKYIFCKGHNTCRTEVLNNLKSKEMVEGIARVITKTYIEDATAKFPLLAKDIVILSNAIQKALIGGK